MAAAGVGFVTGSIVGFAFRNLFTDPSRTPRSRARNRRQPSRSRLDNRGSVYTATHARQRSDDPLATHATPIDSSAPDGITVVSLGSGSSGNAVLVRSAAGALLVDCGVGIRTITAGLRGHGLGLADLAAVLVTHEHGDHVRSLPQVMRAGVPILTTHGTQGAAGIPASAAIRLAAGVACHAAGLAVTPLAVSHDAAEPCGFMLERDGLSVLVVTDLGRADDTLVEPIRRSSLVVLEANHDEAMLRSGPYPAHLKKRVLSHHGHLSNADCGLLLAEAMRGCGTRKTVWLAHLSETNNRPDLARRTVERHLGRVRAEAAVSTLPRHSFQTWNSAKQPAASAQLALLIP